MNTADKNYSARLIVNSTPQVTFDALSTNIGDWWGDQDNPVSQLGDVFTMSWGEPWYKFKVVEYQPNKKITWECIDSRQIIGELEGVEKEWVGTQLHWLVKKNNENEIELLFTHEGLVPSFICYDFCSNTWDRFITFNLKKYLERDQ